MEVQIFGVRKSADTRSALRFFAERRVKTHFVDLTVRAASRGELQRFAQRFGVMTLVDTHCRRYRDLGLGASLRGEDWWLARLVAEPLLLRIPLVRYGKELTLGEARSTWEEWVRRP